MKLETFFNNFEVLVDAPNGFQKLRELILQMAVMGKLVEQNPHDGTGAEILREIQRAHKSQNSKGIKTIVNLESMNQLESTWKIPNTWAFTTLESASYGGGLFGDGDWVESKDQDQFGDIRLIQLADVGDGIYKNKSERFMNSKTAERLNCTYLQKSDILIARMPDPLARACVFSGDPKRCVTVVDVCILRSNKSFFLPEFLIIAINSPFFRNLALSKATGTTRSRISRGNLSLFPIPIPPLVEQHRIVAKVNQLMSLCDELEARKQKKRESRTRLNSAALDLLLAARAPDEFAKSWRRISDNFDLLYDMPENVGALRQAILQLAVKGKLVQQDPNDEPASVLVEKIKAEKERLINEKKIRNKEALPHIEVNDLPYNLPDGWTSIRLGKCIDLISGQHLGQDEQNDRGEGLPYLTGPADFGKMNPIATRWTSDPKVISEKNDILITVKGAGVGKANILGLEKAAIGRQLMAIRPIFLENKYIYLLINASFERFQKLSIGSTVPGIGREDILQFAVGLPPLAEQRRIVAKVDQLMSICDNLEAGLARSQADGERLMEAVVGRMLAG